MRDYAPYPDLKESQCLASIYDIRIIGLNIIEIKVHSIIIVCIHPEEKIKLRKSVVYRQVGVRKCLCHEQV